MKTKTNVDLLRRRDAKWAKGSALFRRSSIKVVHKPSYRELGYITL